MAWIQYKGRKFEHSDWRTLVELLRQDGDWQTEVGRTINQWQSKMNPLSAHTSGSTGEPKQIHLQRDHVEASAKLTNTTFDLESGITALFCLPAQFIAGKMMIIRALVNQWNLIVSNPNTDALKDVTGSIDFAAMTPYQVEQSIVRFPSAFESIHKLIIGGAPIPQTLELQLNKVKPQSFTTYGMTETITHIAIRALNGPNASNYFTALEGIALTRDQEDCLIIKAEHLGNEEVVTNDIAEFDAQGGFILLGRRDNVINSGGVKLHPEHIERKIAEFLFRRFYISSVSDAQFGERPVLIIEGQMLEKQVENGLLEEFKNVLTSIEMPVRMDYHDHLEQTETGKIIRRRI